MAVWKRACLTAVFLAVCYSSLADAWKLHSRSANLRPGHARSLQQEEGGGTPPQATTRYHRILASHGVLNAVGLGFCMPLAITLAKLAKNTRYWPVVFWIHVGLNVVGLIAGIVGTALGSQLIADQHIFVVHKAIGITAIVLSAVQVVVAFAWRPALYSRLRWIYQAQHWTIGRLAVCFGIANVFLALVFEGLTHYIWAYAVVIGVVWLGWAIAAVWREHSEPIIVPSKTMPAGYWANYEGTELAGAQETRLLRLRNTGYAYGEKGQPHPHLAKGQAANEFPENGNDLNGAPAQGSLNVDRQPAV